MAASSATSGGINPTVIMDTVVPTILGIDYTTKTPRDCLDDKGDVVKANLSDWQVSSVRLALIQAGVSTLGQLQNLRSVHFNRMSYEDLSGHEFELPIYTAAQMTCLVSFYHYARGTMYVDTDEDFLDPAILNDLQRKMY